MFCYSGPLVVRCIVCAWLQTRKPQWSEWSGTWVGRTADPERSQHSSAASLYNIICLVLHCPQAMFLLT